MAKTAVEQWDETAANNTDLDSIPTASGTMYPSDARKFAQEIMSQVAAWIGDDTLASATTTDLGSVPARYVTVTLSGTTITGLGTIKAGTIKYVKFPAGITLTHNATSLILPGASNITTTAGDTAIFVSEGSGNWRCISYEFAAGAGWQRIGKTTISGSAAAEISFTSLGGYRALRGSGFIVPATDGVTLRAQASADNGSTWLNGASENSAVSHRAGATSDTAAGELTATAIAAAGMDVGIGNVDGSEGVAFQFFITELNQARNSRYTALNNYVATSGDLVSERLAGAVLNASPHNAWRWVCSVGNIAVGSWIEMEGLL